jgi:hypothetical protein
MPRLLALLVCKRVEPDDGGSWVLTGPFDRATATGSPAIIAGAIWIKYTDIDEAHVLESTIATARPAG